MATVFYEWDVETVDPVTGDILDHNHSDRIPEKPLAENQQLCLVRDETRGGRSWAYVTGNKLATVFRDADDRDAAGVPKRFKQEFAKSIHAK